MVVPGPAQTITFVRQERGPFAGAWLLPGGKVEFGESLEDTARRETLEEAGCVHVSAVRQMRLSEVRPHPTDMQILNDAGVGDYPQADVDAELAGEGIIMTRHLAGSLAALRGVFADR